MSIEWEESLYTDTIHRWRPGFALQPGELEELRAVELLVRELWSRYSPQKPKLAGMGSRNVTEENAAVDRYESEKMQLAGVLLRLAVTDEWRSYFPAAEHEKIARARQIVLAHGVGRIDPSS